jgi:hypothetical protein
MYGTICTSPISVTCSKWYIRRPPLFLRLSPWTWVPWVVQACLINLLPESFGALSVSVWALLKHFLYDICVLPAFFLLRMQESRCLLTSLQITQDYNIARGKSRWNAISECHLFYFLPLCPWVMATLRRYFPHPQGILHSWVMPHICGVYPPTENHVGIPLSYATSWEHQQQTSEQALRVAGNWAPLCILGYAVLCSAQTHSRCEGKSRSFNEWRMLAPSVQTLEMKATAYLSP